MMHFGLDDESSGDNDESHAMEGLANVSLELHPEIRHATSILSFHEDP